MARAKKSAPVEIAPEAIFSVPTDQITVTTNYGRGGIKGEAFEQGVQEKVISIGAHGQISPLRLRKDGDALILVDGEERLEALIRLGIPTARVFIDTSITTDRQAKIASILSNVSDRPTDLQQAHVVQSLLDEEQTLTEVAALLGYGNTNRVSALVKLLSAGEAVREAVDAGKLSLNAAIQVAGDEGAEKAVLADLSEGKKVTAVDAGGKRKPKPNEKEEESGKGPRRNASHLSKFVAENDEALTDTAKAVIHAVVAFLGGAKTDRGLKNALAKIGG